MKRVLWVVAVLTACAPKTAPVAPPLPQATPAQAAELPDGPGRQILQASCTACHGLREVTKFAGFYTRAQWRDVVATMIDYGASVGDKDAEVLTDYLTAHLGKK